MNSASKEFMSQNLSPLNPKGKIKILGSRNQSTIVENLATASPF